MNDSTQAVLLNAVPLLLLAALYLAVGVAIAPALWREHGRVRPIELVPALLFACVGLAALVVGLDVLVSREPVGGNALVAVGPILLVSVPGLLVLRDWGSLELLVPRPREASRGVGPEEPARIALDELATLFTLDLANLVLVDPEGRRGRVVASREHGADFEPLLGQELELDLEPSGVSTVLREGAGFAVYDAETSGIVNPRLNELAQVKSCVFVPVRAEGRIAGVVFAATRSPRVFSDDELAGMQAFLAEAGLAVERRRSPQRRVGRAEVGFDRMTSVLSEPLSADETLDAVARAAAESLGGDSAAVLRRVGGELALAGSYQLASGLDERLRAAAHELDPCLAAGKVLAARRLRGDGRFDRVLADAAEESGRAALLAIPIMEAGGDPAGLVLVFFAEERTFDDDELELAGRMAAAARGALERSDLYERERHSRALAQHLARAGRELAGELDPDNVLDGAVRHATAMLGADGASARLLEGDEVVVLSATGAGAEAALGVRAPSTGWLVGDLVQTRATRAIADARDDGRLLDADPMLAGGHAAYLGVPMVGRDDTVLGILAVYGSRPREWREEDAEALQALAATAAAARTNAELYQGVSHEQQRSEAILANVADGIVAVDREGRVVLWNPAAERVTGVRAEDALGHAPVQLLGRSLDAEVPNVGSRLVPIRRGGDEVWLSLSEAVMTDPAGAVAGRIYAFRDISGERSVERMKTDFVSTVSHELRTPLTSIYGFAETLLRQDVLFGEEERTTFLRYIASESERLTSIVDRLLSVAQVDTGDVSVQLGETDVGALVADVVRKAEQANGGNGHRFVVDVADEPLAAEADREKLDQVLSHLLDNAVRYSPAGGTVTVAARRREDTVEVSVEDEGIGIPHDEQERIFRKFYRGEAASSGPVGTGAAGLGLFLAQGLVEAMNGRISVDSSEGRGATFVLELRATASET